MTQVSTRNEPCRIVQFLEIIAALKKVPLEDVTNAAYHNACRLFSKIKSRPPPDFDPDNFEAA